jgi:hypothetical protein
LWYDQDRDRGYVKKLVGERAEDDSGGCLFSVSADDDHARAGLFGDAREPLGRSFRDQLRFAFDARLPDPFHGVGWESSEDDYDAQRVRQVVAVPPPQRAEPTTRTVGRAAQKDAPTAVFPQPEQCWSQPSKLWQSAGPTS